jgi:hypothetical protein
MEFYFFWILLFSKAGNKLSFAQAPFGLARHSNVAESKFFALKQKSR